MNVLITGANGFIGSHLSGFLSKSHNTINLVRTENGRFANEICLDLSDVGCVISFFAEFNKENKIDVIIHCAAKLAGGDNIYQLQLLYDNLKITESIVSIVKILKPNKLINFSTIGVYPNINGTFDEDSTIKPSVNTDCLYGLAKFCSENIFDFLLKDQQLTITNIRLAQVYGERMRQDRIIPIMKKELQEKNTITVYGNGERVSNFINVIQLIPIIDKFINYDIGGTFNIGGENSSYLQLAESLIQKYGNRESKIVKLTKGTKANFFLEISKVKNILAGL